MAPKYNVGDRFVRDKANGGQEFITIVAVYVLDADLKKIATQSTSDFYYNYTIDGVGSIALNKLTEKDLNSYTRITDFTPTASYNPSQGNYTVNSPGTYKISVGGNSHNVTIIRGYSISGPPLVREIEKVQGCQHERTTYYGFTSSFDYCKKCGEKLK